ncbi:MAG: ACT domain-containing protein [Candidatus Woesearchaeota archaeon]
MNITTEVKKYVLENIFVKKGLKTNIVNYSKLSKKIIKECNLKEKDFDAVVVALRRVAYAMEKDTTIDKKVKSILQSSRIEIKTKMFVTIIEREHHSKLIALYKEIRNQNGRIYAIEGLEVITIIAPEEFEHIITKYFKTSIIRKTNNLAQIILISHESLEKIPGVTAYICTLLAEKRINIVEMMSCWTDTIFLIEEKDIQQAVNTLTFK